MAVDTRNKRASVVAFALASFVALPLPDSSVDAADRPHLAYSYAGTDFTGVAGTGAVELNGFSTSGAGTYGPTGEGAVELNGFSTSGTGAVEVTGTGSAELNGFGASGQGIGGEVSAAATGGWVTDPYGYETRRRAALKREREEDEARKQADEAIARAQDSARAALQKKKAKERPLNVAEVSRLIDVLEQAQETDNRRKRLAAILLLMA